MSRITGAQASRRSLHVDEVPADQLGHLEHIDLAFTAEDRFELGVGDDHGPLVGVLEVVPLNVGPELFGDLGSWNRLGADDGREHVVGLHRFHEAGGW